MQVFCLRDRGKIHILHCSAEVCEKSSLQSNGFKDIKIWWASWSLDDTAESSGYSIDLKDWQSYFFGLLVYYNPDQPDGEDQEEVANFLRRKRELRKSLLDKRRLPDGEGQEEEATFVRRKRQLVPLLLRIPLLFRICLLTFCSIPAFFPCRTQSSSSTQSLQPPPPPPPAQPMVGAADDRHHGGPHTIMSARAGGAQGDESAEKDEDAN